MFTKDICCHPTACVPKIQLKLDLKASNIPLTISCFVLRMVRQNWFQLRNGAWHFILFYQVKTFSAVMAAERQSFNVRHVINFNFFFLPSTICRTFSTASLPLSPLSLSLSCALSLSSLKSRVKSSRFINRVHVWDGERERERERRGGGREG